MSNLLKPRDVANVLGYKKADYVYSLIESGALKASNVGTGKKRPSWRIRQEDLDAFIERRVKQQERSRRRQVSRQYSEVKKYV